MAYRTKYAILLCLAAALAGCGDDDQPEATASDTEAATGDSSGSDTGEVADTGTSGSSGEGDSGDSGSSSDSGGEPEHVDLFACEGVAPSCEQIMQHIDPEPIEALECAGQLVASGQPGLISALDTPGPDIDETEHLILVIGDGTALVQTRGRHCSDLEIGPDDPPCSYDTLPWDPSGEHRLCTLEIDPALGDACDPACETECNCTWNPFANLGECEPVADWTCEDALSALTPR